MTTQGKCYFVFTFGKNIVSLRALPIILLFLIYSIGKVQSQELLPFVENFTMTNYDGDNQVWSSTQGEDNAMYFANNHYFLRYNGVKWDKYILPNKTVIRSVLADGNRIYCGSYTEFGYWHRKNGKMVYSSLSKGKKLFEGNSINEEIWKIFKFQNKIYFQSFNELFIYNGTTIEKIKIPFQISYCFVVNNQIYAASVREGVFKFNDGQFKKIANWQNLENNVVHAIEGNGNKIYVFTEKNGVYIEDRNILTPWDNTLNNELKQDIIITARFINKDQLAIGTAFNGLYLVDMITGTYKNINRNNSLKNNSVLSIGFDKENDLWLGLDNGIAHVEINSPYSIFSDNTGILGSVYSVSFTDKGYLLGSNHGLFIYEDKTLKVLPNSKGHVWDIQKINDQYIVGHNDGTFLFDGSQLNKMNSISGGWKILKSDYDPKIFQANYSGIAMYDNPVDLSKYLIISDLTRPIKNIVQIKPKELWAVDNYTSLYRIYFKPNFETDTIEIITQQNDIRNDFEIKMFEFRNELLFNIDSTWYQFNSITEKLEINKIFNDNFSSVAEIIPVNDTNFIVLKDKLIYIIYPNNGKFIWELIPSKYYEGKIINQNTKVFQNQDLFYLNLDDGFFTFHLENKKIKDQNVLIEAYYKNQKIDEGSKINYNEPLEINVISEYFGYNRSGLFYKLNGAKEYLPVNKGFIILNNLISGEQTIEIYHNNGLDFNEVSSYGFIVARPWYFSVWMIIVYLLLVAGLLFLYYKWNKIRYVEKLKLKEEELKHQKEILQIELEAKNKLTLQEYEKHMLEMQIKSKASEVAGKSLSIAKQTEMIESIQKVLDTESDLFQLKSKINKSIKINALNKKEWESFDKNILQSHEDFVHRLTKKFPNLTSKDIKLCIYLKMNLSSKEIAPLLNISFRGVELHRYRLRKKMALRAEEKLSNIINTI